ncbi:MAG: cob(I)yrinic acid a,c-diamide adenosyltransferase [Candidatus Sumerlaeota bacterium]|nr:cob(I)yrinic acid a,c-diamide adenosyltransferase [Candidatus Sumerlaeota bacterium]
MGCLHVYTGNGKGKTTAAVGLAVRAAGAGRRVAFCQFDKGFEGGCEHYNERASLRALPLIDLFVFGVERLMPDGKYRFNNLPDDFAQARAGLEKAKELVRGGGYFLVVCDEAVACVMTKLYTEDDLLELARVFRAEGKCDLVLTGRGASPRLIEAADLVTDMTLVKHYFYTGVAAREGIEY